VRGHFPMLIESLTSLGYLPFGREEAKLLLQVVAMQPLHLSCTTQGSRLRTIEDVHAVVQDHLDDVRLSDGSRLG